MKGDLAAIEPPFTRRIAQTHAEMGGEAGTDFTVQVETTSEPAMPVVWLRIERQSQVPADTWGTAGSAEIVVRADELDLLLETIAAVVQEARDSGVLPALTPSEGEAS